MTSLDDKNITYHRSKARRKGMALQEPHLKPRPELPNRDRWIKEICEGFVSPSSANKGYYRAVLEALWPKGHGIPGPIILERDLRAAINKAKGSVYHDPFRRIRELQGEEGVTGIARHGKKWQLVSLKLSKKRSPRTALSNDEWDIVLKRYAYRCANCKRSEPQVRLQQDHKIPRLREGSSDDIDNWQPLCDECNNFKSMSCRDCSMDCQTCGWAFPEKFKPLQLDGRLLEALRKIADKKGIKAESIVEAAIKKQLEL